MTSSRWERFTAAMQKPFPELTRLQVWGIDHLELILPDSFLGGSASHLQILNLRRISIPSILKLLLSANGLVTLSLWDIPDSGTSPDVIATALTVMTRLESLRLEFLSPRSRPDPASQPPPPPTRFILPTLTELAFQGVHEYLEDLLARIDAPLLHSLQITFFMDLNFDLPRLHRLIDHGEEFKSFDRAKVLVSGRSIQLLLDRKTQVLNYPGLFDLQINCKVLEWQLSSLTQVCGSSFPLIPTLEELEINEDHLSLSHWKGDIENVQWLELLEPFTALKSLYLKYLGLLYVFSALLELSGERVTEVLPALQNIFISSEYLPESSRNAITIFVTMRQRSGHPVRVHSMSGGQWKDITKELALRYSLPFL